jgi:hypothetical protein
LATFAQAISSRNPTAAVITISAGRTLPTTMSYIVFTATPLAVFDAG